MLTVDEMATLLGITPQRVNIWCRNGLLRGHVYNDENDRLFEHPGNHPPHKAQGVKLSQRRPANEFAPQRTQHQLRCDRIRLQETTVRHRGTAETTFMNQAGAWAQWKASFPVPVLRQ